jgi:hypothetical protein
MSTYYIVEPTTVAPTTPVYDYGSVYSQISAYLSGIDADTSAMAVSLALIATSLTNISTNSTTVASNLTTVAEKQTAMETYQRRLKELGEGNGIRVVGPYELVQFITTYRTLIEEGKLLGWRDKPVSDKDVSKALNDLGQYIEKIRQNIPKDF